MSKVLCLDFGTSSIRAVLRDNNGTLKVIPLGLVTPRQEIDGASIPSAFCIDKDLATVRFGQNAYEEIVQSKNVAFYTTSPKQWITEPKRLDETVLSGCPITRRDVLTGLMGYALYAATQSGLWKVPSNPDDANLRIAHPVWPSHIKSAANQSLAEIAWMAVNMAGAGDWGVTSVEVLKSWTTPLEDEIQPKLNIEVDTIEPIAASVELLPGIGNERGICVVVDVGAGTTDVGVFQYLSPDKKIKSADTLIPAGPSVSVFQAGDEIDRIVLKLLRDSFPKGFDLNEGTIKSRIRFHKESLFKSGALQVAVLYLSLNSLVESPEIQNMAKSIRQAIEKCLEDASGKILAYANTANLSNEITVVMAGGGAELEFLHDAILAPYSLGSMNFRCKLIKPEAPTNLNMHGAGYQRLAVALGGAHEVYEGVVHEYAQLTKFSSLGSAKQVISS